jgi:hypothetical protein
VLSRAIVAVRAVWVGVRAEVDVRVVAEIRAAVVPVVEGEADPPVAVVPVEEVVVAAEAGEVVAGIRTD